MLYRAPLAYIHHAGFSEFAESAASGIVEILLDSGIREGRIIDIGCGSGVLARELVHAGFEVTGIDPSPAMITLARTTAPAANFERGSIGSTVIPACAAITAVGEVLNYSSLDAVTRFADHAASALPRGGLLMFDIAERGAYPAYDEQRISGDGWFVIVIKESDGERLTRRIMSFRDIGGSIEREEEIHELELYDRQAMLTLLRDRGFRVSVRRSYGSRRLPAGHAVYVATRR